MLVKICGLCRPEDAALAHSAGADYAGVVFVAGTPRAQSLERAAEIFAAAGPLKRVGVFSDAALAEMREAASVLRLDVVQLHGSEPCDTADALRAAGVHVWKVLHPRSAEELLSGAARYAGCTDALLLDRHKGGATGAQLDWAVLAPARKRLPEGVRLLVAGGLDPRNVAVAVDTLDPAGVDVSSGIEQQVGRKSPELVHAFVAAARGARSVSASGSGL